MFKQNLIMIFLLSSSIAFGGALQSKDYPIRTEKANPQYHVIEESVQAKRHEKIKNKLLSSEFVDHSVTATASEKSLDSLPKSEVDVLIQQDSRPSYNKKNKTRSSW